MIKSAAIIKTKALAPWKELRLQKRKLKKAQTAERKATKQMRPSPISGRVVEIIVTTGVVESPEVVETSAVDTQPTRDEMLQQAELMGMKVDKRWSDATLLKHIEELAWATQNDNS
jgi:hypothetical protein